MNQLGISPPLVQPLAQFGARNVQHARSRLYFVGRHVTVFVFEVHHHVERHHGDADLRFMLLEQLLRFVRTVERLAVGILARSGVIAADDEVACSHDSCGSARAR